MSSTSIKVPVRAQSDKLPDGSTDTRIYINGRLSFIVNSTPDKPPVVREATEDDHG